MIKIEVTGTTLGEVADKLLAIGGSLLATDHKRIYDKASREEARAIAADPSLGALYTPEVAEAAPVNPTPAPAVAETVSSPSDTATVQPEPNESSETAKNTDASSASSGSAELNFDTDVAPYVLQVVKEKGKPVAQEILSQFGVEKASLLDPAQWPELVSLLKAQL